MAAARAATASQPPSPISPDDEAGIDFPRGSLCDEDEEASSGFSVLSDSASTSLFWDQNDGSLRAQSSAARTEGANPRSPSSPPIVDELGTPHPADSTQADLSCSQASLGSIKSNASAADPIEGYLNVSARRGEVTRTFSLRPSILPTLTYTTLLHILELDVPLRHSRWSTSASRRSTGTPSALRSIFVAGETRSIFVAGEKLISSQPEIWISHNVVQATLYSGLRTARARGQKQWYKLQSFACVDADKFLFDALMAQLLREHVEQNTWLTLLVRQPGDEVPQEPAERGPTGLDRVGKGISRLSIGLGSLFGALDLPNAQRASEDEREDRGEAVSVASATPAPALPPSIDARSPERPIIGSLGRMWRALTGKSHKSTEAARPPSPPSASTTEEEEEEAPPRSHAPPVSRSSPTEHGTVRILSRMSSRNSPPKLERVSQDNAGRIIQRAFSKRSLRADTHLTVTEMRRGQRIVLGEGPKQATRERAESTARRLIRSLSVRRRSSSNVTTESERWERAEAERLRKREGVPVQQAASQETRPSLQERPDIDVAALRRERLLDSPTSSTFAILDHAADQQQHRRVEQKRLPLIPTPPGWQAEHVTPPGWRVEHAGHVKDPFADDQRAQNDWTEHPVTLNEAQTRKSKSSRGTTTSQRSGKSRRSPPPPPPTSRSRGYSFRRRSEDTSAPLRPGGAEIISRPADAGLNAVFL